MAKVAGRRGNVEFACEQCSQTFKAWASRRRYGSMFCSKACSGASRRNAEKPCEQCGAMFYAAGSNHKKRRYCSRACSSVAAHNTPSDFHAHVDRSAGPLACWPWGSHRLPTGYGVMNYQGRRTGAHVLAVMLDGRSVPAGMLVRHTCDNPPCCNPSHLLVGTYADNARDSIERGRNSRGERHSLTQRGENNGHAKLTEDLVREIRRRVRGGESVRGIARQLQLGEATVSHANKGRTWRHVL